MSSDEELAERVRRLERQVERLLQHLGLPQQAGEPSKAYAEILALKRAGRTIDAIKLYRELTGTGLREAKEYVDRLQ